MSNRIKLVIQMRREDDATYSLSLDNPRLGDDARALGGLSEGYITDYFEIARVAGEMVSESLATNGWRLDPDKKDIAAVTPWGEDEPIEFKRDES